MLLETYLLIQIALIPVIVKEFQLGLLEASLVATVPSIVQLLMNIPTGFLADRISAHHLLFASMLIEGLSALLVSLTTSFWALVLGVSLMRISIPLYHICGLSQVSKLAKPAQLNRSMGVHNAFGSFGSALGLISLGVFLSTVGWRWTYLFWSVPVLAWGFLVLISSELKADSIGEIKTMTVWSLRRLSFIVSSGLLIFLIAIAIRDVGATGSSTFMTTYFVETRNLSDSVASLIFALGTFIGIFGALGGGYLGQRMGAKKALSSTIIGCAISLLVLSIVSGLYLLILLYIIYSFFSNAVWSPMNALVADITPASEQGLGFSVYFLTGAITGSIAPTAAASVIVLSDVWFVFPYSVLFFILSLAILQFLRHPSKQ